MSGDNNPAAREKDMQYIQADTHPSRLGAVGRIAGRTITSMTEQSDLGLADILREYSAGDQTRRARPTPTDEQIAAAREWLRRYPIESRPRLRGWAEMAPAAALAVLGLGRYAAPTITPTWSALADEIGSRYPDIGVWEALVAGDGWALARVLRQAAARLDAAANPIEEDPRILAAARIGNQLSRLHSGGWTLEEMDRLWAECLAPLRS